MADLLDWAAATRKSSAFGIIELADNSVWIHLYAHTERESRTRLIGLGLVNAGSVGSLLLGPNSSPSPPYTTSD